MSIDHVKHFVKFTTEEIDNKYRKKLLFIATFNIAFKREQ